MGFVVRFTDRATNAVTYWPKGYGFTSHAHTPEIGAAEVFATEADANRRLNGYTNPPAFWESERKHNRAIQEKALTWTTAIVPVDAAPTMPEIKR